MKKPNAKQKPMPKKPMSKPAKKTAKPMMKKGGSSKMC